MGCRMKKRLLKWTVITTLLLMYCISNPTYEASEEYNGFRTIGNNEVQAQPQVVAEKVEIVELTEEEKQKDYIAKVAKAYDLAPELVYAVIQVESSWNEYADSGSSKGLMQLNKNTYPWLAEEVGIINPDPFNWKQNVQMGCWYLDALRTTWLDAGYVGDDVTYMMLISYNRGVSGAKSYIAKNSMYDNTYANKVLAIKYELERQEV